MYVPLRVHGWHSLLTGVDSPGELLWRGSELGLGALALTDVDSLAGLTDFLRAAQGSQADDVRLPRPIVGAEISDSLGCGGSGAVPGRVVALVRDETGYRNLCKLVSARQLGDDPGTAGAELRGPEAFDLVDAVLRFQEGLVFLVDHPRLAFALAGRVPEEDLLVAVTPAALNVPSSASSKGSAASRGKRRRVTDWKELSESERPPVSDSPKVPPPAWAVSAEELVQTARTLGLATVATVDVYWSVPAGRVHHQVRTAIKYNALRCDLPERWLAQEPAHLLSPVEMHSLYRDLPEASGPYRSHAESGAVARTLEVAERCRYVPPLGGVIFPDVELGEGETAYSRLCGLAFDGAQKRYTPMRPEVVRRLDYELSAIEELGFAAYFLLVRKIADFASERGIPHVGRGSAADSLVAYCLELTDADPLRYKLPFERFLNPSRKDRPDIDLDFCWRRRNEVIEHVWEAFGAERTAMISTLNRFGLRSAFREASLAEGVPPVEVNRWSRRLPWMLSGAEAAFDGTVAQDGVEEEREEELAKDGSSSATVGGEGSLSPGRVGARDGAQSGTHAGPHTHTGEHEDSIPGIEKLPGPLRGNAIAQAFAATPECRDFPFEDARMVRILEAAAALIDAPRHLGLHPGGVVVAPGPITDVVACQRAAKGVIVTQLDKDGVEALGLVKMDLLGNRALTVIDDCLRSLADEGVEVDLTGIDEEEPLTAGTLARGGTLGCFQVESPGMRNLLKQTAARTMDDVIQAVALIRPGPAGSGMKDAYVRRFRGLEEPHAPHPRLSELLWDTHGVMLYQEDVMQTVSLMAGMDLAEADLLRRALAKRRSGDMERMRLRYFEGCAAEGIETAGAERVWELVCNFASFGFCKAHAVTYGRISYRAVYLKTHWPAPYLVAFLNSQTGYYETRVYVEEARRLGATILPPDVNRSSIGFTLERTERPSSETPPDMDLEDEDDPEASPTPSPPSSPGSPGPSGASGFAIRIGLERVKGLSEHTIRAILSGREEHGAFLSLPDFLQRTRAHVDETEKLIQTGAFDAFDRTRPEMSWRLHLLTTHQLRAPKDARLDLGQLAACKKSPDSRARETTLGWSGRGLGLGPLQLEAGENASLFPEPRTPALALPRLPELDERTRGRLELELLGLTVASHPTQLFPAPPEQGAATPIDCALLDHHRDQRVSLCGWLAASRRVRTSDGRWMRFLTLEDTTGIAEVVLFSDVYERDGHRLVHRGPFRISGRVEDQMGACTLHADRIHGTTP